VESIDGGVNFRDSLFLSSLGIECAIVNFWIVIVVVVVNVVDLKFLLLVVLAVH